MAIVTISGDLTEALDLVGGNTYSLTALCNLGSYNVTSTTVGPNSRVTVKTNGTSGFRINSTGTWNTSYIDFTSKNDLSRGEDVGGSGSPAAGDQTVGYLIQTGTSASSITMSNFTVNYCTPATQTPAIGHLANSTSTPWTLTNGRFSYVTVANGTGDATVIIGTAGPSSVFIGNVALTNVHVDDTCQINQTTGSAAIRVLNYGTLSLTDVTVRYTGTGNRSIETYCNSGTHTINMTNVTSDAKSSSGIYSGVFFNCNGVVENITISRCFMRNSTGHGFNFFNNGGTQTATIINSLITGCSTGGTYGVYRSLGSASVTHTYNDYYDNANNCFEALHGTEKTTNPGLANLPAGCVIKTSTCDRPDGYAITGYDKNGSDTFDNLVVNEAVYSGRRDGSTPVRIL